MLLNLGFEGPGGVKVTANAYLMIFFVKVFNFIDRLSH